MAKGTYRTPSKAPQSQSQRNGGPGLRSRGPANPVKVKPVHPGFGMPSKSTGYIGGSGPMTGGSKGPGNMNPMPKAKRARQV